MQINLFKNKCITWQAAQKAETLMWGMRERAKIILPMNA